MCWRGGALARGSAACFKRCRPASQTACPIRATRGRLRMRLMRPARCSRSPAASPLPAATRGLPGCHQPPWAAPSRQPSQFLSGRCLAPGLVTAHPCAAISGRQEDIDAAWTLSPPPAASPLSPAASCLLLAQPPQFHSGGCIVPACSLRPLRRHRRSARGYRCGLDVTACHQQLARCHQPPAACFFRLRRSLIQAIVFPLRPSATTLGA